MACSLPAWPRQLIEMHFLKLGWAASRLPTLLLRRSRKRRRRRMRRSTSQRKWCWKEPWRLRTVLVSRNLSSCHISRALELPASTAGVVRVLQAPSIPGVRRQALQQTLHKSYGESCSKWRPLGASLVTCHACWWNDSTPTRMCSALMGHNSSSETEIASKP